MTDLKLFLFGSPRFEKDGRLINLRGRKIMALAAYLAVARQSHSRDTIATLFWPDYDQSTARANLRRELSRLNKALGEGQLAIDRETVGLGPEPTIWLDVEAFKTLVTACQPNLPLTPESCAQVISPLTAAVDLYTNDFLAGFTLPDCPDFNEWQFFQTESLRQQLAGVLEMLVGCHTGAGEFEAAIAYARRWLALDTLHEPVHRALMQLYALSGQRSAALRQYEECVRLLGEELGSSPAPETSALYERLRTRQIDSSDEGQRTLEHWLVLDNTAPTKGPGSHLPALLTPIIGRAAELAELTRLLAAPDPRLITLIGPGGIGKTHLALETAHHQLDRFDHGVFFVSLTPLESADTMVAAMANSLNFSFYEGGSPQQQLLDYLRQKEILLVLDNFEHLPDGGELVVEILKAAPRLKFLVTSQIRLNVQGEQLLQLAGLDYPPEGSDALEEASRYSGLDLFIKSVRRTRPDFEPEVEDLQAIAWICRLVQGVPLGILLAAAWSEILTPTEIAAEIERSFDFLETDMQGLPERQRSLRAVFNSAWQLLTEPEQAAFAQLSIFRGGFTRQAGQIIAGASLRDLMSLRNKSLLHQTSGGRYQVHELLRQYATEKLAQLPIANERLWERYSTYYAEAMQHRTSDLRGGRQQAALADIESDIENVRSAWNWALAEGRLALVAQMVDSLFHFMDMRSRFQEGAELFRRATTALSAGRNEDQLTDILSGKLLARQGWFMFQLGQHEQARIRLEHSLKVLRNLGETGRAELAFSLNYLGVVQKYAGDYGPARQRVQESLEICQQVGDLFGLSIALNVLGQIAFAQGDYAEARAFCQKSLDVARQLDHRWGIAFSLTNLGQVAYALAEYAEAEQLFEESLEIRRQTNDRRGIAICLNHLGEVAQAQESYLQAKQRHQESLALFNEIGNQWGLAVTLVKLGEVTGQQGAYPVAWHYLTEALRLATEMKVSPIALDALVMMATILIKTNKPEQALELLAFVMNHQHRSRDNQNKAACLLADLVKAGLAVETVTAARVRAKSLTLESLASDLLVSEPAYFT